MTIRFFLACLALNTLHSGVLANEFEPCENEKVCFRITIRDHGQTIKEHYASLSVSGSALTLRSTAKPDYKFFPEHGAVSTNGFETGSYRAYVADRPLTYSGTPVHVATHIDGFDISGPDSISIEMTQIQVREPPVVADWLSPFHDKHQNKFPTIASRLVSPFGAGRTSFRTRHLHTGTDLAGIPSEFVYPIGPGVVEFVSYWDFEGTILVRHRLASGQSVLSKYIHVREPKVHAGEIVTQNTVLARLFSVEEFRRSNFKQNHLHLEVRKDYSDHGHASTHSQSTNDLSKCCINPLNILPK